MTFRVTFRGSPGTYYDQAEPAEFESECPVTGELASMLSWDMYAEPGDTIEVRCSCGDLHDVTIPDERPDPYDAWRDARDERGER